MEDINQIVSLIQVTIALTSAQICTDFSNLGQIVNKLRVTSPHFFLTQTTGPFSCAAKCLMRKRCKSFNFRSGECALLSYNMSSHELTAVNDSTSVLSEIDKWPESLVGSCASHHCGSTAVCRQISPSQSTCDDMGCQDPPVVLNAKLTASSNLQAGTPFGKVLKYSCDPGFEQFGRVECLNDGFWTSMSCRPKPSSCVEVLECNSTSVDGEYWLYLRQFEDQRVRVYCHDMMTSLPEEFISLINPNWGVFPPVQNKLCRQEQNGTEGGREYIGIRRFTKIKVDLFNLQVITNVTTFATGPLSILDYGTAADCYTAHPDPTHPADCGVKGSFILDLTHTSFQVDMSHNWKPFGNKTYISVFWVNSQIAKLTCGGSCGGCEHDGPLLLDVYTEEVSDPLKNPATSVNCTWGTRQMK